MINHQDLGYKLSTMINFYAVKMDLYELFVSKVRRSHKIVPLLFLIFVLSQWLIATHLYSVFFNLRIRKTCNGPISKAHCLTTQVFEDRP